MPTASSATGPEAQIRVALEDWSSALRAKDAKRVVAHHAADYVQFSLAPPLISDAADAEGLEAWFATWRGPLRHELHDLSIMASGDTAFCHGLTRLGGTKIDGEEPDIWFRLTLGLRKTGGAWKIVHEHESVPFYMDGSYKAAVDLAP